jgi:tRNA-dihydrouridine synthase A
MLGRAAYQTPMLLMEADNLIYGESRKFNPIDVVANFLPQIETWLAGGRRLGPLVRPMLGFFHGAPGARRWRQILTVEGSRPGAGIEVVERALAEVMAAMQARRVDKDVNRSQTGRRDRALA